MTTFAKLALSASTAILLPVVASATTLVYDDRVTFETEHTGLATEDFEGSSIAPGNSAGFNGPLNSATNNALFATGSVIDGFSLSAEFGEVYVGNSFGGIPGTTVSSNSFGSDIVLDFSPAVSAVGLDLFGFGSSLVASWTIDFSGTISSFSTTVTTPGFFGIATDEGTIASLFLDKPNSGGTIDNLTFGEASFAPVPVPAALPLLLGALGAFGIVGRRRRKAA